MRFVSIVSTVSDAANLGTDGQAAVLVLDERQDAYGWRAQAALDAICAIPAPESLIVWLGENRHRFTGGHRDLPKQISRSWNDRIPAEAFDALCLDLVNTYERAAELFSRTTQSRNLFDRRGSTEG